MTDKQFEALANFIAACAAFYGTAHKTTEQIEKARHVLRGAEASARIALTGSQAHG